MARSSLIFVPETRNVDEPRLKLTLDLTVSRLWCQLANFETEI